ncbi:cytochrome c [Paradesulfitobacterium aromaticivorans]
MKKESNLLRQPVFRVGFVLLLIVVAFIIFRTAFVPKSFGVYGFYRGDNVAEWTNFSVKHSQGLDSATCVQCHSDKGTIKSTGVHQTVNCESCHSAAGQHAQTPFAQDVKPSKDNSRASCLICHEQLSARPEQVIRQVDGTKHNGDAQCITCHGPHSPWAKMGGKKPW